MAAQRAQRDAWQRVVEAARAGSTSFSEQWDAFRDGASGGTPRAAWWPSDAARENANLSALRRELGIEPSDASGGYDALHRFSIEHKEEFWAVTLERLGIVFDTAPERVLEPTEDVTKPRWFPGARLDITLSCFTAASEKPAIVFGRENSDALEMTTYGELERDVNRFARGLASMGLSPDHAVALYMPMTPECVVAYLGTVRAGCRVVSIADSFSADELRSRLEIASARAIVTVASYTRGGRTIDLYGKVRDALTQLDDGVTTIVLAPDELSGNDVAWDDLMTREGDAPSRVWEPGHVTNVLFSSGTTGTPKAIPWTELTPLKAGMDAHYHQDMHPDDVLCWPTNIGWMMGPWLVYASFLNDATMALYEGAPTGQAFTRFVQEASVTVLGVVPSIVRAWRASESVGAGDWSGIRLFSSTGEASNAEDYLWLMSSADYRAPVIEYLGGTEIGGGHLTGTVLHPASPATFTTPALGAELVILDEDGAVVREGETGELYLVPPAVGLSERLLNREHDAVYYDGCPPGPNGEVLRRHGDHVARLAGGYYKAQGRADDTMNLGGIKVSSLELERVVNDHPDVHESAAVSFQPGGEGADQLVLYVVLNDGARETDLRGELKKRIAAHLNPLFKIHELVVVEALPRTASNKIMRRRLRAAYSERGR